jgi:hypothetical protein
MNPQIKQKWLNALRSGEYQQTQRYLHDENGFCCLGVLCDLYGKENNVEWNLANNGHNYVFQDMVTILPRSVVEWAGVKDHNADFIINETRTETLANLNDTGFTFNEIADVIEEQL